MSEKVCVCVLNNLVQTGYHMTKPNRQARKPPQTEKDNDADRNKTRPEASSPCTAQHMTGAG
jgi:hypothetical protein